MFHFDPRAKQKNPMDPVQQALSLILHGCRLAKELEARLGDLANQPETLSKSCDDIINTFASAKEMLNNAHPHQGSSQQQTDPSLQELLNYGVITQAMDMIQSGRTSISIGAEIQAMEVSDSAGGSSSSSQRSHRSSSKHDEEKCRMRVPAPQMGNTDLPPEDNYTWRKYGQKEILGSRYPRAYYRCTHQKLYNCPAKKQVQRLDNDFHTFEVTYIGQHTCHMSSTAPSIAPLIQDPMAMVSQPTLPPPTSSSSVAPLGTWLSMEFSLGSGSGSNPGGRGGGDAGAPAAAGGGAASMGSRYGREVVEFPAVADMADAMFNSGSSSSNSMDFIFPHMEDKWEAGDKAN